MVISEINQVMIDVGLETVIKEQASDGLSGVILAKDPITENTGEVVLESASVIKLKTSTSERRFTSLANLKPNARLLINLTNTKGV
jgi:hypothetical protein